jgi:hypothetical protein
MTNPHQKIPEESPLKIGLESEKIPGVIIPLDVKHRHERDNNIYMVEETHKYYIKKKNGIDAPISISGTGFLHLFFDAFDSAKVAQQVVTNAKPDTKYFGKTKEDVINMWSEGTKAGTIMHKHIEDFWNGIYTVDDIHDKTKFGNFSKMYDWMRSNHIEPYRTEWMIYDTDHDIAGSIDFVGINTTTGKFLVLDWKRSSELRINSFKGKVGNGVCSDIEDCNGNHYQLQVNLYRYMLEKNYGLQVEGCIIVNLHPDKPNPEILVCVNLQDKIKQMIDYWASNKEALLHK